MYIPLITACYEYDFILQHVYVLLLDKHIYTLNTCISIMTQVYIHD